MKLYEKYGDRGFTIMAVNVRDEDAKTVKRFVKEYRVTYPVLLQGRGVGKDWGVHSIPASFFVNREGRMVKKSFGFDEHHPERLEKDLQELLE